MADLERVAFDRGYSKFVGRYKVSFVTMTVFEADGELHMKVPLYGGGVLQPITETLFATSSGGQSVKIEFIPEEDGSINKLLLHRDGQKVPVPRVQD